MDCAAANLGVEFTSLKTIFNRVNKFLQGRGGSKKYKGEEARTQKLLAELDELLQELKWISTIALSQGNHLHCCTIHPLMVLLMFWTFWKSLPLNLSVMDRRFQGLQAYARQGLS